MAKEKKSKSPVGLVPKLVSMLTPLSPLDRMKAIRATFTLLADGGGDDQVDVLGGGGGTGGTGGGTGGGGGGGPVQNEQAYFGVKRPRTNIEALAVAARYRESRHRADASTRAELQGVFKEARHNFVANYRRDLENARKAGLFTRGTGRDAATLTAHGQQYVDALPDRDAVKALAKPKKAPKAKKKKKA